MTYRQCSLCREWQWLTGDLCSLCEMAFADNEPADSEDGLWLEPAKDGEAIYVDNPEKP